MTRIRPRPAGFRYRSQLAAPSPAAAGATGPTCPSPAGSAASGISPRTRSAGPSLCISAPNACTVRPPWRASTSSAAAGTPSPAPGRPPHAVPPDADEAVPVPGQPPPGDPEPAGGDLTAEPRPRIVVTILAGYLGRAGVPPGRGERHDRRPELAPRPQDHVLVGVAPLADVDGGHVGQAGDHQVAALPGDALHLDVGVQVPPVGPVDAGRDLQL